MKPEDPIVGKVAAILNSRELVLNIGIDSGVKDDMCFEILENESKEILDPDSGDKLGTIDFRKVQVKVTEVREKFSIACTYKTHRKNIGGSGIPLISSLGLSPPQWITEYETLKRRPDYHDPLDESESIVNVGDRAVQIIDVDVE